MASTVSMGDPRSEPQLVNGFYTIEADSWRWTARQFTIVLRPPFGAAEKGAVLKMQLTVPDPVIAKLQTISLAASVNGHYAAGGNLHETGANTRTRAT